MKYNNDLLQRFNVSQNYEDCCLWELLSCEGDSWECQQKQNLFGGGSGNGGWASEVHIVKREEEKD